MNFSTFIVKLIEDPVQSSFKENIRLTEVLAIISTKFKKPKRKPPFIKLTAWGNLSNVLMNYYQKDDLLIVEGIISCRPVSKADKTFIKSTEVTLISFYPYEKEENSLEFENFQVLPLQEKSSKEDKDDVL